MKMLQNNIENIKGINNMEAPNTINILNRPNIKTAK